MTTTVHRSAEITVGLPLYQAMALFTPEGERRWADGWDPHYEASRREGPGTVFTTEHGGHHTTWVMVDQEPTRIRYVRVVHGLTAGTIAVDAVDSRDGVTQVRVTYDLTALSSEGEAGLASFEADYDQAIAEWSVEIDAAIGQPGGLTTAR